MEFYKGRCKRFFRILLNYSPLKAASVAVFCTMFFKEYFKVVGYLRGLFNLKEEAE